MDRYHQPATSALEASLVEIINEYNQTTIKHREHAEKSKKEAIRQASRVADVLVEAVNGGVQEGFVIEKRLEMEIRALAATIMRFGKQTDRWLATTHALNTAVKEIGDFENWMKTMEFDCKSINAAVRNIHQT